MEDAVIMAPARALLSKICSQVSIGSEDDELCLVSGSDDLEEVIQGLLGNFAEAKFVDDPQGKKMQSTISWTRCLSLFSSIIMNRIFVFESLCNSLEYGYNSVKDFGSKIFRSCFCSRAKFLIQNRRLVLEGIEGMAYLCGKRFKKSTKNGMLQSRQNLTLQV